jgi:hypothetical protein
MNGSNSCNQDFRGCVAALPDEQVLRGNSITSSEPDSRLGHVQENKALQKKVIRYY